MFSFLGRAVARYWPIVLITWCLLLILGWVSVPAWASVARSGEVAFLPSSTPSQRADQLFRNAFPAEHAASSIVLVLWREDENLKEQDRYFITDTLAHGLGEVALLTDGHPPLITCIRTLADPGCGALLVAPDHTTTLILMELSTPFIDPKNPPLVARVEEIVSSLRREGAVPEGLQIAVTGSATAGRDMEQAAQQSARTIAGWAVALVVALCAVLMFTPVLLRWPGTIWLAGVAACLLLAGVALLHCHGHCFNPIGELPADMPSVAGLRALKQHFPAGCLSPVTVLLENDRVDFTGQHGIDLIGRWTAALRKERDDLGLVDIRSVAKPLGTTAVAKKALANIPVPAVLLKDAVRERAVRYYVSRTGEWKSHVTRVDLTLQVHPLSRQALDDLPRIKEALQTALPAELADSRLSICGPTASARDLAAVKKADLRLMPALVPAVVFVLLVLSWSGRSWCRRSCL